MLLTHKELEEVNSLRVILGLPKLVQKTRVCLKCGCKFQSQGLRLCKECQKLRRPTGLYIDDIPFTEGDIGYLSIGALGFGSRKVGRLVKEREK